MRAREFLSRDERKAVVAAVVAVEKKSSGEIRIHLENECSSDPRERALRTFHILKMSETASRSGVLIYIATASRKLAVIGDKGINTCVPTDFWRSICDNLIHDFSEGKNAEGLIRAVTEIGDMLSLHFPYMPDDVNELSDDISYGDEEG